MKKTFIILSTVLVSGIVSLGSCSKGEYNSGDGQTGYNRFQSKGNQGQATTSGNFSAKINGNAFTADNDKAFAYSNSVTNSLMISGFKGAGTAPQGIVISINKKEKGTYTIDASNLSAGGTGLYNATGSSTIVVGQTGKIEILEISDAKVKGTFEMNASGLTIKEGSFDIPIK